MSEEIKKVNPAETEPETTETPDEGEGYAYCNTVKQKCMTDCLGGGPMLSTLN